MKEEKKVLTLEEENLADVTGGREPEDVKGPDEIKDLPDGYGNELPRGNVIT